jgi:hypothetical protein
LLQDDAEYKQAMEEAATFQMGAQLRNLFLVILLECDPQEPAALYEAFKDDMAEDFTNARRGASTDDTDRNKALLHMRSALHTHRKTLQQYGLPEPVDEEPQEAGEIRLIAAERAPPEDRPRRAQQAQDMRSTMNEDQGQLYDDVVAALETNTSLTVFVDAPGGAGKTFVGNALLAHVRSKGHIALPVAISGVAALLYDGGRTAHSRFGIPIKITAYSTCNITRRSEAGQLLREAKLILWDEASMTHRYCPEALDRTLRDLMKVDQPFGGKVVIFLGDFRQVLAVVKRGSKAQIIAATLKNSHLWRRMLLHRLTINERVRRSGAEDQAEMAWYAEWLLKLGSALLPELRTKYGDGVVQIERRFLVEGGQSGLIAKVFPGLQEMYTDQDWMAGRSILTPKNTDVDAINDSIITNIIPVSAQDRLYLSADKVSECDNDSLHPTEFLNSINVSGLPPHQLHLKPDVPIMLLRNLDPANGLCNGTVLIVKKLRDRVIQAVICTGHPKHLNTTHSVLAPHYAEPKRR